MYHWYLLYQRKHQAPISLSADSPLIAPGTPGFDHGGEDHYAPDDQVRLLGLIELLPVAGGFLGAFQLPSWWMGAAAFTAGMVVSGLIAFFTRHRVPAPPLYSRSGDGPEASRLKHGIVA
jgi:hypothetical protein